MAFAYLLLSTLVIQVGPFVSFDGHSLYKGTQLLLVDPLYWTDDFTSIFSRTRDTLYGDNLTTDDSINMDPSFLELEKPKPQVVKIKQRYAVVFDGGSTGTRVQVFVFNKTVNADGSRVLLLAKDHFRAVKPGLSSYANNPPEAAASLIPLLEMAASVVPEEKRRFTPLLLRATAGLRLLPIEKSEAILHEVFTFLSASGFKVREDSVSILDGESEGTYAWLTVNALLNRLHNPKASVAVLDLGGGSTQVAFTPTTEETTLYSSDKIVEKTIVGRPQQLYTHSYLGFGLMSARKSLLTYPIEDKTILNDRHVRLSHPCFGNTRPTFWEFENTAYHINGSTGDCYEIARRFFGTDDLFSRNHKIDSPRELNSRIIYAISYYYDRAVDVGLLDAGQKRGSLRVKDFYYFARAVCGHEVISLRKTRRAIDDEELKARSLEQPFLCMDMSYIAALLREGLGLNWNKEIKLACKLKGVETSWALGAAYDLFM